jgi:hypothetical protein
VIGPSAYRRTTVYLTEEQLRWLRRLTAQAQLDEVPVSASDVVRLGLDTLRGIAPAQLRAQLITHVVVEAEQYPGRLKKGMPATASQATELCPIAPPRRG